MPTYTAYNAPMATAAATAKVTTGTTSIKTMLQIATPSTRQLQILSWGYSIDAAPAASGTGVVELIQTDVAATVAAHIASGVQPIDPNGTASLMTLGVNATGYTASAEGSITATRLFDAQEVLGVSAGAQQNEYMRDWMPDERPIVAVSKFLRVRVTFSAAVNMLCWVTWAE